MSFKDSEIYKAGKFYEQYGAMMQNPNTTLDELVEFCHLHNRKLGFGIYAEEAEEEQDK